VGLLCVDAFGLGWFGLVVLNLVGLSLLGLLSLVWSGFGSGRRGVFYFERSMEVEVGGRG
jgi:hypothetical protein